MLTVTLYTKDNCQLCEEVKKDLEELKDEFPHQLVLLDIEKEDLTQKYGGEIPVVEIGPYTIKAPFDQKTLRMTLGAAQDRADHLRDVEDEVHQKRLKRGRNISALDRFFYWFSNHYMAVFNLFLFLYVGLAFLAPTLKYLGWDTPAHIIYTVYSRLCHQLSFRSWFLFGEQIAYPLASAGVKGWISYAEATGFESTNFDLAHKFVGNALLGYKLALCQRDIAIYGSIFLFGLIFSISGRRIRSIPFWAWIIVGMVPIGWDGISQLLSQLPWDLVPYRESTPLLRTVTGALFGFTTAWFGYPLVEETMEDTRGIMAKKFAAINSRNQ